MIHLGTRSCAPTSSLPADTTKTVDCTGYHGVGVTVV